MAIKINLESTVIPIEIVELKFEIDVTDEKYETFTRSFNALLTKVKNLDVENREDIVQIKAMFQAIYDELLGIGSYEQIYAKMPNLLFIAGTLSNIVTQLVTEMDKRTKKTSNTKVMKKPTEKR